LAGQNNHKRKSLQRCLVPKPRYWDQFEDRWNGIAENLDKALSLAARIRYC